MPRFFAALAVLERVVVSTPRPFSGLSEDLPIVIQVVDKEERIDSILPVIEEMAKEGLVILETVDVIICRSNNTTDHEE